MLMENTDKKLVDYKENLAVALKAFEEIQMDKDALKDELRRLDEETQDVLHILENLRFNVVQGFNLALRLKKIRQERREVKHRIEQQEEIRNVADSYRDKMKTLLETGLNKIDNLEKKQSNRTYRIRRLKELEPYNELGKKQRGVK